MKTKLAALVIVLLSLACGQATLPQEPVYTLPPEVLVSNPILTPTTAPTETAQTVTALGKVNVRTCPATSCEVIGVIEAGAVIEVGLEIQNEVIDCPRWYPVKYNNKGAFVCAEWFTK